MGISNAIFDMPPLYPPANPPVNLAYILLPNGNTATFTAFVKKFNSQGAVDQAVRRSADLRISGTGHLGMGLTLRE